MTKAIPLRSTATVALRAVTREYGTKGERTRALDEVGLGFAAGSWTAVMGPSGSGKSTLLHCAAGLERCTSGQILMVLSGGYAVVTVINAIVIAGAQRRTEFAVARASGLYRGQVARMALVESGVVAAIGVGWARSRRRAHSPGSARR